MGFGVGTPKLDLKNINSDMVPETDDVFDLGGIGKRWKNVRVGKDLVVDGNLTVRGLTTIIESTTLTVDDKNIELASSPFPSDILADGGGITLKGDTDKTILWKDATDSWDFNQAIRTGNLQLNGNTLSSLTGDLDVVTQTGGVFKFDSDAIRAGLDASNYLEIGHGGSNAFINAVGAGGQDFRFGGVTKATFTPAGHLHLVTDTDQKHNLRIKTASNANDSGIAWENSGGNFSQTIFRTDVGSNRSDLVFAIGSDANIDLLTNAFVIRGAAASEGNVEILQGFRVNSVIANVTDPVVAQDAATKNYVDTQAGGGFTDDGTVVRLTTLTDDVGIGTAFPDSKLHVTDAGLAGVVTAVANTIATFENNTDGFLSILTPDANEKGIFFGGPIINRDGGVIYNTASVSRGMEFRVNGNSAKMFITSTGKVGIGESGPDTKLHVTDGGSAGVVTAFSGTIATLESPGNGFLSILTPDAGIRGILFGEPSSNIAGGIFYNDPGSLDGFQFRVNGNVTKMVIEGDGKVGIGTTNPDITALLDLTSITKGFLPPRMTTVERDAIVSPLPGLRIHNTTVDKAEVFTGATWKTILTEDIGQVLVQETFASTNVRFLGELALPAAQGWTDISTGIATIDLVTQTVFGEVKQVVRHNDDTTGGATTSDISLTVQNWTNINAFGASYGGTARLDTVDGANGFFSGLQANAAENPLATGNRRYGVLFNDNAGNLRLTESDNTGNNVTMDGTSGNPLVAFDEWFSWECVVPAGLGAAEFYINSILTSFIPTFFVNGGGLGTAIKVGSGSTSGVNRIVYHDNFGVTIFEEAATKTLAAATMAGDVAQINIPEGKRDYVIILPDGNPRPIGAVLRLVVNNLGGSVDLQNENPAAPEVLYNGLRTLVINVAVKETIEGINTVSSGNVYLGFQTSDIDQTKSIFAQLSSSVDQDPIDTNPTVITYNTQDGISGITHSTTVNPGEITIDTAGTYYVSPQAQVGKTSGGVKVDFDMFWQIDRGSGFVDEANSNIKLTIKDSDITDVIVSAFTIELNVGDKIRMMQKTSASGAGMGLKNTDPVTGPPTVPRTPAIIFTMYRVGGLAV